MKKSLNKFDKNDFPMDYNDQKGEQIITSSKKKKGITRIGRKNNSQSNTFSGKSNLAIKISIAVLGGVLLLVLIFAIIFSVIF